MHFDSMQAIDCQLEKFEDLRLKSFMHFAEIYASKELAGVSLLLTATVAFKEVMETPANKVIQDECAPPKLLVRGQHVAS